ncbi:MAG: MBOAT family protein, partial [Clostridiales bacterium]|nr:MBOAT family protein [Clostridiales bacterium]
MVFSQLSFLYFFFPLVILLYFPIKSRPWRNGVLLVCSLLFYSWGEPRYVIVMVAASLAAWLAGLLIERFRARPGIKKLVLTACVALLLGNLMVFKYLGFLV